MESRFIALVLTTTTLLLSTSPLRADACSDTPSPSPSPSPVLPPAIKAGYWPAPNNATFPPSSINPSYFTHIFYAFVQPDPSTFYLIITPSDATLLHNFTTTLHSHHPPLQALLSIGGAAAPSALFANLSATPASRAAFIASSIAVARTYNLDGLDLDWEFPQTATEMSNLGHLYTEWRAAVEHEASTTSRPRLLLSSAVYYASEYLANSYAVATMSESLDLVNAMCFDYHGGWDPSETGAHAALYDPKSNFSTSYGITSWLAAGVPAGKVVMGLPLYGRTWTLRDPGVNGIGAPAVAVGPGAVDGTMVYSEVVEFNEMNGAAVVDDATTASAYSYVGTSWIGYDDEKSTRRKVEYAREKGLGGYFFWALGFDYDWSVSREASIAWES